LVAEGKWECVLLRRPAALGQAEGGDDLFQKANRSPGAATSLHLSDGEKGVTGHGRRLEGENMLSQFTLQTDKSKTICLMLIDNTDPSRNPFGRSELLLLLIVPCRVCHSKVAPLTLLITDCYSIVTTAASPLTSHSGQISQGLLSPWLDNF
jgi:hypothetical protein